LGLLICASASRFLPATAHVWAVLKMNLPRALAAIESALQGVRIGYELQPPFILLNGANVRLTVKQVGPGVVLIGFRGSEAVPKLRLFKNVARKFLLYGAPGGNR